MDSQEQEARFFDLIKSTGALREGHFVLASGRHSGCFVNKDDVSTHPYVLDQMAKAVAGHFWGNDVEVVAALAVGAIAFGNRVAYHYHERVKSVFAEQVGGRFVFKRDYDRFIRQNTVVLIVEDIITTGKTTKAAIEAVLELGGEVAGVGLLWNRSQEELGVPTFACVNQSFETYEWAHCPLCRKCVPIDTKVNKHGIAFLQQHGEDPANWPSNRVSSQ